MIASFDERRAEIARQLAAAAAQRGGCTPIDDEALLDEVTALVERPNVLLVPLRARVPRGAAGMPGPDDEGEPEVLPAARRDGPADRTAFSSSATSVRPTRARVDRGQRARRAAAPGRREVLLRPGPQEDARVARRRASTRSSTTASSAAQGERVERVRAIARGDVAGRIGADCRPRVDRAALLAKADLLTDMVGEFPELQGIDGRLLRAPRRRERGRRAAPSRTTTGRASPATRCRAIAAALVVALADKLETLVGMFGIGEKPTGERIRTRCAAMRSA